MQHFLYDSQIDEHFKFQFYRLYQQEKVNLRRGSNEEARQENMQCWLRLQE